MLSRPLLQELTSVVEEPILHGDNLFPSVLHGLISAWQWKKPTGAADLHEEGVPLIGFSSLSLSYATQCKLDGGGN